MHRPARRHLARFADFAIPWAIGLFLVLVVLDERGSTHQATRRRPRPACCSSIVQAVALRWRRERARAGRRGRPAGRRPRLPAALPARSSCRSPACSSSGRWRRVRPPRGLARSAWPALLVLVGDELLHHHRRRTPSSRWALAVGAWALGEAARNRRVGDRGGGRGAPSADEQARIARELHDVIAHSVSMIVVQAARRRRRLRRAPRPGPRRAALDRAGRARRAARAAPAARRRCGPARRGDPTEPQPGLDRLDELAEPAARRRPRGGGPPRGRPARAAGRRRPVGLPDRPGGAHQHAAPRPRHARRGDAPLRAPTRSRSTCATTAGRRRRATATRRPRPGRHARARRAARRHARGRARCPTAATASTPACRWSAAP